MAKLKVEFEGFKEISEKLDRLGGNLKATTDQALKKSFNAVTPGIVSAMAPHRQSGDTESSLKTSAEVTWNGLVAEMPIGFDISKGGLPSVFLMFGTPKISPDRKLYNAVYGSTIKKKVNEIQENVFMIEIGKVMK